ncbi:MAG: ABC transporter substrate-binding protein [Haloechinothrix sp.]
MTTRRTAAALLAAATLLLAACGTRVDHDTIVQAAAGGGAQMGTGEVLPGEEGVLGGSALGDAGQPGTPGAAEGELGAAGQQGAAGSARAGATGKPGAAGSADGGQANREPIVIGSVGSYSGPSGVAYAQAPRAVQAWAATINAKGGINGHPVKVIVMDDGADAGKSRSQVQELVESRKAVAIVAAMTNAATLASWKGYVEQKKVPVIGGDCGPGWDGGPTLFRQCVSSKDNLYGIAVMGAKHGKGKKFGGLFCQEADDCAYAEDRLFNKGDAKRAGLDPRYRARISLTQPDFTSECIQARNAGVELLLVAADPNTVARVASSCRRQNFSPQFLQPDATMDANTAAKPGFSDALIASRVFPFTGLSTPAYREFDAAWKKYGGGQAPGPAAAMGWASAKVLEKAARGAGNDISSASLLKELYSIRNDRFSGLTVPLTFAQGNGASAAKCLFFMKGAGGKWTAPQGDRLQCW